MSGQRAIIDIGSNTIRLVVYGSPLRAPAVVLNEKVTARLGREVSRTGKLGKKSMATALAGLARFAALLRLMDVRNVEVVATAAVRDASNGAEFLADVAALGFSPRLLSGDEEARTSALGVLAAFPDASGLAGDLGGGSLELTTIGKGGCGPAVTAPLGTLRLPDLRASGDAAFARSVRASLSDAGWREKGGQPLYLAGGSWRTFALFAMSRIGWPIDDPHGFEVAPDTALTLCGVAVSGKFGCDVSRIASSRLAALPDAAALLAVLIHELKPSRLVFSSWGLREGLLFSRLDEGTRAQNPTLAGVAAFTESIGIAAATGAMVAGWTAAACGAASRREEDMRLAAVLLCLAEMRSEPNFRAEEAMDWALRKRWIGTTARDRAMLGMAVLGNSGRPAIPRQIAALAPEADLREAAAWGLAVRLCRKLTACTPAALSNSALNAHDGRLELIVREPLHALYSDGVGKALRQLAEWRGMDHQVKLADRAGELMPG